MVSVSADAVSAVHLKGANESSMVVIEPTACAMDAEPPRLALGGRVDDCPQTGLAVLHLHG